MLGDELDWVRVFGCGLEIDQKPYMGASMLKLSRSRLNISGSEYEWAENEWGKLKRVEMTMGCKWVGVGGRGWEWVRVGGSGSGWMGVGGSE